MAGADYYKQGSWNAVCFRCGAKRKGDELKKQWQGYWVCPEHWEPRHPQDFVKGVQEHPEPPFSQPEVWVQIGPNGPVTPTPAMCTVQGNSSIAGYAMAGCMVAGKTLN